MNTEGCGMSSKDLWNVARERMLPDRAKEEEHFKKGYKATHEENVLCSWLREDVQGTEERRTWTKKSEKREGKVVKERRREKRRGPHV